MTSLASTTAAIPVSQGQKWSNHLVLLGLAWVATLVLFAQDVADMATIWWNISTFGHCLFILPISAWLVQQRQEEVAKFAPHGWLPGAACVFGAAVLWAIGEAAGIALFRHAAVVFALQGQVLAILGPRVFRALLFPVLYLAFLIPVGEELVPTLQTITAKLTIWLLGISNVPHIVNGVLITIPNGYFEVAEECSGVKFLIAMIAYGALVCNVCFKSWTRRALFMLACIIVPILANGVRAFGTIWLAWMVDRDFAKGFDHIVYGWFFFAIVLALLMGLGWRFFDRKVGEPWLADMKPAAETLATRPWAAAIAAGLALTTPVIWQNAAAASGQVEMRKAVTLPVVARWALSEEVLQKHPWQARFDGADQILRGQYQNTQGKRVDLVIALYAWQEDGRELVGYGQGAVDPSSLWVWTKNSITPKIGSGMRITAPGPVNREVVTIYSVDGTVTGSAGQVKLATIKTRLLGRDQAGVAILVSAEEGQGRSARALVDEFLADMPASDKLASALVTAARGR